MKQSEKLDLILRGLYQFRHDGKFYSIASVCEKQEVSLESLIELRTLAKRLKDDNYIKDISNKHDVFAALTSHGIEYCEEDSYSNKGHSIITNNYNLSISHSPNANIVSDSSNVTIQISNYSDVKNKIKEVRDAISSNKQISKEQSVDMLECLDEIEASVETGKIPKFTTKYLIEQGSNIAGIGSLLLELGKLMFIA